MPQQQLLPGDEVLAALGHARDLAHPSGRRAGAEWIDGRFSSAWAWVPGLILTKVKARELRAWIEGAPCQNER